MTIKSDRWIKSQQGMIEPFFPELRRTKEEGLGKAISYGLSSFGYDIRCAPEFKVFSNAWGGIADPRSFNEGTSCVTLEGDYCIVPPNGFVLTRSIEKLTIPRNVLALVIGKSTYARCGLHCLTTPLEPMWSGEITLEFANTSPNPAVLYANEGCAQVLFFESDEDCEVSYADRKGKYQNQVGIVLPKL